MSNPIKISDLPTSAFDSNGVTIMSLNGETYQISLSDFSVDLPSHADTHSIGGSDPLTPMDIGADVEGAAELAKDRVNHIGFQDLSTVSTLTSSLSTLSAMHFESVVGDTVNITSEITLDATHLGKFLNCTGTFNINLPAATLTPSGSQFAIYINTGTITVVNLNGIYSPSGGWIGTSVVLTSSDNYTRFELFGSGWLIERGSDLISHAGRHSTSGSDFIHPASIGAVSLSSLGVSGINVIPISDNLGNLLWYNGTISNNILIGDEVAIVGHSAGGTGVFGHSDTSTGGFFLSETGDYHFQCGWLMDQDSFHVRRHRGVLEWQRNHICQLQPPVTTTSTRSWTFPDKTGTVALEEYTQPLNENLTLYSSDLSASTPNATPSTLAKRDINGGVSMGHFTSNIYKYTAQTFVTDSTTARTLTNADLGKTILFDNNLGATLTVPASLSPYFWCSIAQLGDNQVTLVGSGTTLNTAGVLSTTVKYSIVSLSNYGITDTYILQ